jgi:hypothetical protein
MAHLHDTADTTCCTVMMNPTGRGGPGPGSCRRRRHRYASRRLTTQNATLSGTAARTTKMPASICRLVWSARPGRCCGAQDRRGDDKIHPACGDVVSVGSRATTPGDLCKVTVDIDSNLDAFLSRRWRTARYASFEALLPVPWVDFAGRLPGCLTGGALCCRRAWLAWSSWEMPQQDGRGGLASGLALSAGRVRGQGPAALPGGLRPAWTTAAPSWGRAAIGSKPGSEPGDCPGWPGHAVPVRSV